MRSKRFSAMALAAVLGVAASIAVAGPTTTQAHAKHRAARLAVGVEVFHFAADGRRLRATGRVTATLTSYRGRRTTVHSKVAMTASVGGGCRILHLYLKQLTLTLLGLRAHLDQVRLDITGRPHDGVLGSLFCRLARAKASSARASAARALNARVRRHRGHVLRFKAYIRPQATTSQAPHATCQVLDLVVGPLHLELLGLVVDLNRVHLNITATRGEGALGDLFCALADNHGSGSTSTKTSSTTTTTTSSTSTDTTPTTTGTTTTTTTTTGTTTGTTTTTR